MSILLYGCTTWTQTKRLEKKLDGNYTKMLRAILSKCCEQYWANAASKCCEQYWANAASKCCEQYWANAASNIEQMLRANAASNIEQIPTRHQQYGHQPPITKTIKVRRIKHAGNCWRRRDELINDVLLWTPSYGQAEAERLARTYIW